MRNWILLEEESGQGFSINLKNVKIYLEQHYSLNFDRQNIEKNEGIQYEMKRPMIFEIF